MTNRPAVGRKALVPCVLALLASLGTSCQSPAGPEQASNALRPAVHLIDHGFEVPSRVGLAVETAVSIDDVFRPTFSAGVPKLVGRKCEEGDRGDAQVCRAIRKGLPPVGAIVDAGSSGAPEGGRVWVALPRLAQQSDQVEVEHPAQRPLAFAHLAPPLEARTVTTDPVVVPPKAVLRFAIGMEEPAWHFDSPPVTFSIVVVTDDDRTLLFEEVLDPHRDADARGWHERSASLGAWAGQPVKFVFRTVEPSPRDSEGLSLPVWGDPTIFAPEEAPVDKPWVVLVSLDTLRARSMSVYGREYPTTPYLEEVAAAGTTFARAFTTYPKTNGSHMSAFTGLLPHRHGLLRTSAGRRTQTYPPNLAQRLRSAGWRTVAFTENGLLGGDAFSRGYERYEESKFLPKQRGEAKETFARTLDYLSPHKDEGPFYVFVHTYDVHGPYNPPEEYRDFGPPMKISSLRRYEQETRALDDLLREFVPRLEELAGDHGLLLVIFADHGEEFFEHGSVDHHRLFDEVMHVPLLFRWPGYVAEDRIVEDVVSLTDVSPTVLELVGLPSLPDPDGTSLASLLGPEPGKLAREIVFGQVLPQQENGRRRQFVARSATAKCLSSQLPEESYCFDLVADPLEKVRLRGDDADRFAEVRQASEDYRHQAESVLDEKAQKPAFVDHERRRKLEALGYIEED